MNRGITIIELLVIVAIMSTIGVMSTVFYSRFLTQNEVDATRNQLAASFRKAQIYSMTGKQDGVWGVRYTLSPNKITLYLAGNSAFDESFNVNDNVTITGFTDITFARITGMPSTSPTITISGGNNSKIVTLMGQNPTPTPGGPTSTPTPTPGGPTATPTPTPVTPGINFTKKSNLDTYLVLPVQIYPWNCHNYNPFPQPPNTYMTGDGSSCGPTGTYLGQSGSLVYEMEFSVVTDAGFPERGKMIKYFRHPAYPVLPPGKTKWDHHGFIMNDVQKMTIGVDDICTGGCWYGVLLYFSQAIGGSATKAPDFLGVGGGTINLYITRMNLRNEIRLYQNQSSPEFIKIPTGTWVSLRAFVPALGGTQKLIVTDLNNNTLPGTIREITYSSATPVTNLSNSAIDRVKYGVGGEEDGTFVNYSAGYYFYQDNMYAAAQTIDQDPGVWKE